MSEHQNYTGVSNARAVRFNSFQGENQNQNAEVRLSSWAKTLSSAGTKLNEKVRNSSFARNNTEDSDFRTILLSFVPALFS